MKREPKMGRARERQRECVCERENGFYWIRSNAFPKTHFADVRNRMIFSKEEASPGFSFVHIRTYDI